VYDCSLISGAFGKGTSNYCPGDTRRENRTITLSQMLTAQKCSCCTYYNDGATVWSETQPNDCTGEADTIRESGKDCPEGNRTCYYCERDCTCSSLGYISLAVGCLENENWIIHDNVWCESTQKFITCVSCEPKDDNYTGDGGGWSIH